MADAMGDDDAHPIVDIDDGGHPIRTTVAAELPMGRPRDADDDRTGTEDGGELRDADPVAADEAPHLVPPDAPRDPDRRWSPCGWGHPIWAIAALAVGRSTCS